MVRITPQVMRAALDEIERGVYQRPLPEELVLRLLGLKLVGRVDGNLQLTLQGRVYLKQGR